MRGTRKLFRSERSLNTSIYKGIKAGAVMEQEKETEREANNAGEGGDEKILRLGLEFTGACSTGEGGRQSPTSSPARGSVTHSVMVVGESCESTWNT